MDSAAQGARLLAPFVRPGTNALLDVGCGGAHFYHSLRRLNLPVVYHGLDSSPAMVRLAKGVFKKLGLDPTKIILGDVRDLTNRPFDLVAMINTLSFNADFRQPLDRLAATGARVMIVRDFFGPKTIVKYETDGFLDPGFNHLKGYWNQWSRSEVTSFLTDLGYRSTFVTDDRSQGKVELVVNKPYRWSWLIAEKDPSL
jgi:SAM-dependent methyltransferase